MSAATDEIQDDKPASTVTVRGAQRMARVYAEALLSAAESQQVEGEVLAELDVIYHELLPANEAVGNLFGTRVLNRKTREEILRRVFGERSHPLLVNFLLVLNRRDRLFLLRPIIEAVLDLRDERAQRVRVNVTSAVPLDEGQQQRLRDKLRAETGKEPVLRLKVDPDIIGGLLVQVGDDVYDATVRTRLGTIRHQLLSRGRHEIQRGRDRFRTD